MAMYLSYSGFKVYESCMMMYYFQYIAKTPVPPENRVHALYGTAVGYLFEAFYNEKLWKLRDVKGAMLRRVQPTIDRVIAEDSARGIFDWKVKDLKEGNRSVEEVTAEVSETVERGIAIIKYHRLLGVKAYAEVKLDSEIDGNQLGGRADFLIRRLAPFNDKILLDGKGSRWRDQYVDRRQLKWYAFLHERKTGKLPDKVGFVYWRSKPEDGLDWVSFTPKDIEILKEAVSEAIKGIEAGKKLLPVVGNPTKAELANAFRAQPGSKCKRCAFLTVCELGTTYVNTKVPLPEGPGVEDVGF